MATKQMSAARKRQTTPKSTVENKTVDEAIENAVVEEIIKEPKEKKFAKDDLIEVKSITNGELLLIGKKTNNLYQWADYGDVTEIEYQDLLYSVRSAGGNSAAFTPCFVVLDDDFVKQNKALSDLYDKIYSVNDLRKILELSQKELEKELKELPIGVKNTVKGLAATMIDNGELNSLDVIKTIDDVLGSSLLLTLASK